MYRLAESENSPGLWCDRNGLSYNQTPLFIRNSLGLLEVQPLNLLNDILDMDVSDHLPGLESCARTLNKGDVIGAAIKALHLKIPMTFDVQSSINMGFIRKSNFNPSEARNEHGRWTSDGPTRSSLLEDVGLNDAYHNFLRDDLAEHFRKLGAKVATEVRFDTVSGYSIRADMVVQKPDGLVTVLEIKTGNSPTFTTSQMNAYPMLEMGGHASSPDPRIIQFGLPPNSSLPPLKVYVTYKANPLTDFHTSSLDELYRRE